MTHHLGTWVSAVADRQLGPAATERALAHVAGCPTCAHELTAARQARQALSVARDVEPGPALTARLLALAAPPGHQPVAPLGMQAPARALDGDLTARRRPLRCATAALAGLGIVLAGLALLGEPPTVVPTARPVEALAWLANAREPGDPASVVPGLAQISSTSSYAPPTTDIALDRVRGAGWARPQQVPDGYEVTAVRPAGSHGALLEVDLVGLAGRIVLTEQRGRLDVGALAAVGQEVGGRTVYVLTGQPWHAVWQCGDTVVSVFAQDPTRATTDLVVGFPAAGYDDALPARLARGWHTLTGALERP